jgi:hypothetical protein
MKMKVVNLLLCVGFLVLSCNRINKNSSQADTKNDTVVRGNKVSATNLVANERKNDSIDRNNVVHFNTVKVDTIIEDIHISYVVRDNNGIVSARSYDDKRNPVITNYADRSVFISLKRNNKNILSNREIKKTDFRSIISNKKINKYNITSFQIETITKKGISFFVNICIPDTDICYPLDLFVSNEGVFTIKEKNEGEMGD